MKKINKQKISIYIFYQPFNLVFILKIYKYGDKIFKIFSKNS